MTRDEFEEVDYAVRHPWEECIICARPFQPALGQGMKYRNGWACSKHAAEILEDGLGFLQDAREALGGMGTIFMLNEPKVKQRIEDLRREEA